MNGTRKRILFVSHTGDWTGPTNSLLLLLRHLRRDYHVAVVLRGSGLFCEALAREQVQFFRLPSLNKRSVPALVELIKREGFHLVYGNSTSTCSQTALIAAKLVGVPFICHVRGMGWGKSWRDLGFLKIADAAIAVSDACAQSVARFVPQERLFVVHNGVETLVPEVDPDAAREYLLSEMGLAPDDVVAVSVSHVCKRKGVEYAVRAMAQAVREAPHVRLLIAGSLEREPLYVEKVRGLVRQLDLERHVFLLGFRRDITLLLHGAQVFLHTALNDPHPRPVMEAMEAGLPVAAFAVDGVSETVVDGQTGFLVPSEDIPALTQALLRLVRDPALRAELGRRGQQRIAEAFSASGTARRVASIIDQVLES